MYITKSCDMSSLKRIYIQNVDYEIKKKFTEEAKALKVNQAHLFEKMWEIYIKSKKRK